MDATIKVTERCIEVRTARKSERFWEVVNAVKAIAGRKFEPGKDPHWELPCTPWQAREIVKRLQDYAEMPEAITELAKQADALMFASRRTNTLTKADPRLYPFQNAALEFLDMVDGRALMADEFGLGKTVMSLVWIEQHVEIRRVLIVCPANVLYKWERECKTWAPRLDPIVVPTVAEPVDWSGNTFLMTYTILTRRAEEVSTQGFDIVVADECHALKNFTPRKHDSRGSQRAIAMRSLAEKATFFLALSGAPLLNRPIELWPILSLIDKKAWGDRSAYGWSYCGGRYGIGEDGKSYGFFQGANNRAELHTRLRTVMIRRLKKSVMPQLPKLTRTILPVDIDLTEYRRVSRAVLVAIRKISPEHKGYYLNMLDKMNMLRQAAGVAKAPVAVGWATDLLENSDPTTKLVIYCHHRDVAATIAEGLHKFGTKVLDGSVEAKKRDAMVTAFQGKALPRVLVITAAGGEGIDLFGLGDVDASRILFVEREYVPAVEEQAEGRLHRRGQKNAVEAFYLVANHTIDERMAKLIEGKRTVINEVVGLPEIQTRVFADLLQEYVVGLNKP